EPPPPVPPPSRPKEPHGAIVGHLIAHYRGNDGKDHRVLHPGDEVILTTVGGGRLAPVYDSFVVVDYFKSEMSEYDSNHVFVPLAYLQHLRTMQGRVTSIQIKLKDYGDAKAVVDALKRVFPDERAYAIETWEDKQSPLL